MAHVILSGASAASGVEGPPDSSLRRGIGRFPYNFSVMRQYEFSVYLMTNRWCTVLYTGVTNDLSRRVHEHKQGLVPGFTKKYNVNKLVFFEAYADIRQAIDREKQIKGWVRRKKNALIERENPNWVDLAESWYD